MGGGPDPIQTQAAQRNAAISEREADTAEKMNAREQDAYDSVKPYATSRINNGLPYINTALDMAGGSNARAFAGARGNLARNLSTFGTSLPSGFATGAQSDLDAEQGRAYDDALMGLYGQNEAAKRDAASVLMGEQQLSSSVPYYGGATQTNASIYGSQNLRKSGIGGVLAGIAGGALKAAAAF
jgi:hypothetical protein